MLSVKLIKFLNETSNSELENMDKDLRDKEIQALKDVGDTKRENTTNLSKRLPEEKWKELKKQAEIISAIRMIHSILTYTDESLWKEDYILGNKYMQSYIESLGAETVANLATKEIIDFKENATINHDVYTDSEGVSYNSVDWNK